MHGEAGLRIEVSARPWELPVMPGSVRLTRPPEISALVPCVDHVDLIVEDGECGAKAGAWTAVTGYRLRVIDLGVLIPLRKESRNRREVPQIVVIRLPHVDHLQRRPVGDYSWVRDLSLASLSSLAT
jgi:hypothetical protein